jgi:hypothetical protein
MNRPFLRRPCHRAWRCTEKYLLHPWRSRRVEPVAEAAPVVVDEIPQRPTISRPAGTPIWSRAGEAVGSLVGAGLSTTRSFVVMVMAPGRTCAVSRRRNGGGGGAHVAGSRGAAECRLSHHDIGCRNRCCRIRPRTGISFSSASVRPRRRIRFKWGWTDASKGPIRPSRTPASAGKALEPAGNTAQRQKAAAKWIKASDPAVQMSQNAGGVKALVSQNEVGAGSVSTMVKQAL